MNEYEKRVRTKFPLKNGFVEVTGNNNIIRDRVTMKMVTLNELLPKVGNETQKCLYATSDHNPMRFVQEAVCWFCELA